MVQCEVIVANASFGHAQLSVARPHTCVNRGSRWAGALPPANQTQNRPPPPPPAAWQVEAAGGIIGAISARRGQNFAASGGAPQGRRGREHAASTDCSTSAPRAPPPPGRLATCRAACCGASARHLSSSEPLRSQNFRRLRRGASGRRGQALQSRMRLRSTGLAAHVALARQSRSLHGCCRSEMRLHPRRRRQRLARVLAQRLVSHTSEASTSRNAAPVSMQSSRQQRPLPQAAAAVAERATAEVCPGASDGGRGGPPCAAAVTRGPSRTVGGRHADRPPTATQKLPSPSLPGSGKKITSTHQPRERVTRGADDR